MVWGKRLGAKRGGGHPRPRGTILFL
jgi:hypothetical protein